MNGLVLALDAANSAITLNSVEVLVVAGGGGGGGGDVGAGGGSGGLIYNQNFAVTPGSALTVTVGDGGAGSSNANADGSNGSNSVFGSLTATGGGGGASWASGSGQNGGSGGGSVSTNVVGQGTIGQGNNGGNGLSGPDYPQGGGGGAGSVGQTATIQTRAGDGGVGLEFPQFSSVGGSPAGWFAGGGGGGVEAGTSGNSCIPGTGGLGGGGNGGRQLGTPIVATSGATNTGGGGGGNDPGQGGSGGSGIVIVRYPGPQKAIGGTVTSSGGYTIHTFTSVGSSTFTPLSASSGSTVLGLTDISNRGNFGTAVNGPTYSSANGGSIVFDGTNDYVTVGSLGSQFTNFTVEIWFKSDSVESYRNPIDCNWLVENGSYSNLGPRLEQNSAGNLNWIVGSGSDVYSFVTLVPSGLSSIPYHHAVITKTSSTNFNGYYNGNYTSSLSFSGWAGSMLNVNIGRGFSPSGERWFIGKIPSVKVYNRALSAAEIQQNFNALRGRYGI
jgi:hypothetical protein